jgi:hypothetical protein
LTQTDKDKQDFYAEKALDRIQTLRWGVVDVFGREAAYNHMFYGVPLLKGALDCKPGEVGTPHRLAFQSDEGLAHALTILQKMKPKRG